jgi:3-methyladenine DNA glycosylase/8-oxoguanine DNA glycosylase
VALVEQPQFEPFPPPAAERVNLPRLALETTIVPRPPYSLAASARGKSDATRRFRDGVLTLALDAGDGPALARVHQRPDGSLFVRIEGGAGDATLERLRFILAADEDHSEFLARFARDPLLADSIRHLRGLRPLRCATVAHALLKALCGQLIQASAARRLEARLLRAVSPRYDALCLPPTAATFAPFATAELVRYGLAARKAATLVRLSREVDPERLRGVSTDVAAAWIERERGLGPWSAGMICLYGLGRREKGLVGDLGLIKLCAALHGRWADADDTRALLEPYGEWAGIASVYLLAALPKPPARLYAVEPRSVPSHGPVLERGGAASRRRSRRAWTKA